MMRVGVTPAQLASIALARTEKRKVAFFITRPVVAEYQVAAALKRELLYRLAVEVRLYVNRRYATKGTYSDDFDSSTPYKRLAFSGGIDHFSFVPIPETTSAETFERYVGGKCLRASRGKAWRDIKACIVAPPRHVDNVPLPAVSEPFLAWVKSGEANFQERENGRPWITHRIRKGSFFLTSGGAPYDCRWKAVTPEPFEAMYVFIELSLLQRALDEIFGGNAAGVRLRDVSAFTDAVLNWLMERLCDELMRRKASPLFVQGIAQAIAIHLARNYTETVIEPSASPSLPGYKLRQITDWMGEHFADEFNLDQLATQAGLSKFHFDRLFKSATGVSPSRYHINLRMDAARRLLRETKKSIVEVALDVGYVNPSHFAQLFRRETDLSPSEYRRQR